MDDEMKKIIDIMNSADYLVDKIEKCEIIYESTDGSVKRNEKGYDVRIIRKEI